MKLPNQSVFQFELDPQTKPKSETISTPAGITVYVDETDIVDPYETYYKNEEEVVYKLERLIRTSFEYRQYVQICRTEFDLTRCKFIPEADLIDKTASIELHHYPLTLFDIAQGVLRAEYGELGKHQPVYLKSVNLFELAHKVMKLHYEGVVGLVPLSLTAHELAHNGDLFIPLLPEFVFGDFRELIDKQRDYGLELNPEVLKNVEVAQALTEKLVAEGTTVDTTVLDKITTTVVHTSFTDKPNYITVPEDLEETHQNLA